ncbi:MAG: hypothetical protein LN417_07040 [Candidatus Thermoplasmatota archaeon]|nr:hypothetical protein [Candidatus Thermoplasmatota archaeon]
MAGIVAKLSVPVIMMMAVSVIAVAQIPLPDPHVGDDWIVEVVDSGNVGMGNSLAIDREDHLHISYVDGNIIGVKHAKKTPLGWDIDIVDSMVPGQVSFVTSIDVDNHSNPHISYVLAAPSDDDLRYAIGNESNWSTEIVEAGGHVGQANSIALDGNGHPHISYTKFSTFPQVESDLKYASWDGFKWNIEVVDHIPDWITETSVDIDDAGHPHISYAARAGTSSNLKYAEWNGSEWKMETVDFGEHVGPYTSMELDSNNNPHVAYYDPVNLSLMYAMRDGSGWHLEVADTLAGERPSIYVDRSDRPHIAYSGGLIGYALRDNGGWRTEVVTTRGAIGSSVSLAVNSTGFPHISFDDFNSGELKHAARVDPLPPPSPSISLDIDPDTLNLKSKGRWITAYLSAENASVHDIDVSTILLQDALAPERWDYQDDVLMLKFSRQDLIAILEVGESVEIKLSGKWKDGTAFEAYDYIRVINPGK